MILDVSYNYPVLQSAPISSSHTSLLGLSHSPSLRVVGAPGGNTTCKFESHDANVLKPESGGGRDDGELGLSSDSASYSVEAMQGARPTAPDTIKCPVVLTGLDAQNSGSLKASPALGITGHSLTDATATLNNGRICGAMMTNVATGIGESPLAASSPEENCLSEDNDTMDLGLGELYFHFIKPILPL
ncbi:unnamed protein product [Protopolystoma xenopodis]|uniref:Uncharacterized protein n=1 Tax=Protopolystoma xenopodis TaxID=117903 RepID=A0A3S5CF63_9PLAT|nr:unnamed protein product [Protopolystoma xenopodis]